MSSVVVLLKSFSLNGEKFEKMKYTMSMSVSNSLRKDIVINPFSAAPKAEVLFTGWEKIRKGGLSIEFKEENGEVFDEKVLSLNELEEDSSIERNIKTKIGNFKIKMRLKNALDILVDDLLRHLVHDESFIPLLYFKHPLISTIKNKLLRVIIFYQHEGVRLKSKKVQNVVRQLAIVEQDLVTIMQLESKKPAPNNLAKLEEVHRLCGVLESVLSKVLQNFSCQSGVVTQISRRLWNKRFPVINTVKLPLKFAVDVIKTGIKKTGELTGITPVATTPKPTKKKSPTSPNSATTGSDNSMTGKPEETRVPETPKRKANTVVSLFLEFERDFPKGRHFSDELLDSFPSDDRKAFTEGVFQQMEKVFNPKAINDTLHNLFAIKLDGMRFQKTDGDKNFAGFAIVIFGKLSEKVLKLLYRDQKSGDERKFSKNFHNKYSKTENIVVKKYCKILNISVPEKRLINTCTFLNSFMMDKGLLANVNSKLQSIAKLAESQNFDENLDVEEKKDVLLYFFKSLTDAYERFAHFVILNMHVFMNDDSLTIKRVLRGLTSLESIKKSLFGENVEGNLMEKVKSWINERVKRDFMFDRDFFLSGIGGNPESVTHRANMLFLLCDQVMLDVAKCQKKFVRDNFVKEIGLNIAVVVAKSYSEEMFNELVAFCDTVSKSQMKNISDTSEPKKNENSLEMFRRLCPKFVDTWNQLKALSGDSHNIYSLFYQIVRNTISDEVSLKMSNWVQKCANRNDFEPIDEKILHSRSAKDVLEISFSPLEGVYEIDSWIMDGVADRERPLSLVFVYIKVVCKIFVDYIRNLAKNVMMNLTSENRTKKNIFVNNIQGSLIQLIQILETEEIVEAIKKCSTGGEFSNVGKTLLQLPMVVKMINEVKTIRNEVALNLANAIFVKIQPKFMMSIKSLDGKRNLEELMEILSNEISVFSEECYIGIVEKTLEYLFLVSTFAIEDYILGEGNFYVMKNNIDEYLKQMSDFLYCDGDGLSMKKISQCSLRLHTIMRLFSNEMSNLMDLYGQLKESKLFVEKKIEDYTREDIESVNVSELSPSVVLRIINRIQKITKDQNVSKFISKVGKKKVNEKNIFRAMVKNFRKIVANVKQEGEEKQSMKKKEKEEEKLRKQKEKDEKKKKQEEEKKNEEDKERKKKKKEEEKVRKKKEREEEKKKQEEEKARKKKEIEEEKKKKKEEEKARKKKEIEEEKKKKDDQKKKLEEETKKRKKEKEQKRKLEMEKSRKKKEKDGNK